MYVKYTEKTMCAVLMYLNVSSLEENCEPEADERDPESLKLPHENSNPEKSPIILN